jgi:serine/threonine-protein kinase
MGVVYEGYDLRIKRAVALKTIRSDQSTATTRGGDRAVPPRGAGGRPARAPQHRQHLRLRRGRRHLVHRDGARQGRELKDYFQANERFAAGDIVRIMTQILAALGYSHRLGVVHRDIKPANIFLLDDGTVKVTDFGIAHLETSSMTQAGAVLGTPAYMSPEQILGMPVDGRSDLFSAGVILYQILTGERPFSGSSTATMHKVLEEDPLPPSRFNVQVPGAVDGVVRKALAKRPVDRYQTPTSSPRRSRRDPRGPDPSTEATLLAPADPTMIAPPRLRGSRAGAKSQRRPSRRRGVVAVAVAACG